jgi:dTDP-4-dehydrorhamnose 3,5-epimerase
MVVYLCSQAHNPEREFGVNPLDPDLDIHWSDPGNAIISAKDANARMLKDASLGLLPLPKYEGSK